jgi:glycine/D-amino acid oxidase-like deaminating enzyme/nitrite reductase/ring-hydroxylating ferredoxin subunit
VDVVVVGGGIAGIAAAWFAAGTGASVALLEAHQVGSGVTGHTTAKVTALQGLVYRTLARRHGNAVAGWYAQAQQAGLEALCDLVATEQIDCELERLPAYTYAPAGRPLRPLEAEQQAAERAGIPAVLDPHPPLPFEVAGSVRLDDQAQLNPGALMRGWADAARRRGVLIHEHTRVVGLRTRPGGGGLRVTTATGAVVRAQDVVVATHYPVFDRALIFPRVSVSREFAVSARAPQPLTGMFYGIAGGLSVRSWRHEHIISGRSFRPGSGEQDRALFDLERAAHAAFPALGAVRTRWAAQDVTSHDGLPYVGRMLASTSHVHLATGFRGWGMTNGVAAGLAIAGRIAGDQPTWSRVLEPARTMLPSGLPAMVKEQAAVGREFAVGLLPRGLGHDGTELRAGEGRVLTRAGRSCAVARDDRGQLHSVSSRCTHLGCEVSFNAPEQTWECGCHGSRFGIDGTVLSGPALQPLAPRDLPER